MHTVGDLMTRVVVTANADDVVGPIRDLMIRNGIHCVPVLGTDETLLGIITSTDLIEEWAPQMGVETVMTRAVETVSPHQSIVDAAHTMIDRRIHHLVVTERDRVVGVVSALDLLRHFAEPKASSETTAAPATAPSQLRAQAGDVLVVRGAHVGDHDRRAVIEEVHGPDGEPPYVVRWTDDRDDHQHLFFPSTDAHIEARPTS
jgi:CBS domain-containing protein